MYRGVVVFGERERGSHSEQYTLTGCIVTEYILLLSVRGVLVVRIFFLLLVGGDLVWTSNYPSTSPPPLRVSVSNRVKYISSLIRTAGALVSGVRNQKRRGPPHLSFAATHCLSCNRHSLSLSRERTAVFDIRHLAVMLGDGCS